MVAQASERSEGLLSTLPLHPLLFAFYPVVRLYAENAHEVPLADVVVPLLLVLAVTLAALVLLSVLFRDPRRAAIVVSAGAVVLLGFGLVEELLSPVLADARIILLIGGAILMVGALVLAWRVGPRLGSVTLGLNVISIVLVILASVPAVQAAASEIRDAVDDDSSSVAAADGTPQRDIYHIVLDRYGSESSLQAAGTIDNSEFTTWLRDNGFQVVDDAHANYTKTTMSMGATLGMGLLDGIAKRLGADSENLAPVVRRVQNSKAGAFLQERGYEYAHIGTWFNQTRESKTADVSYTPEAEVSFGTTLYDLSILPAVVQRPARTSDFKRKHADAGRYQLKVLDALAEQSSRKYVLAHILLPHRPYVFLEDGTYDPESATYETQLAFINRRMREFIEPLLALPEDERPIIIVQADEGPWPQRFADDQYHFDWSTATDDEIRMKFGILNAMYLPGPEGEAPLRDDLSAVNTYPELFRRYFGADIDDRPDRVMASSRARPYDLIDLTERLEALEADEAG